MKKYIFLSILAIAMLTMVIGCGQGPGAFGLGVVGGTGGPDSDGYGSITAPPEDGEGGGGGGDANLIGEWHLTGLEINGYDLPIDFDQELTFYPDGTGEFYYYDGFEEQVEDFTWSANGSTLDVVNPEGGFTASYTVTDTTLIVSYSIEDGDNYVETYTKQ